jgi:hypothetical protein
MRRLALFSLTTLVFGCLACAKSEQKAAADSGMPSGMMPKAVSVSDFAGTWALRAMPESSDSVLVAFDLVATADTTTWTWNFPGRDPVPTRILQVAGDSVVTETGPYSSALRKGVMVTTRAVSRLQDGKMVGTFVAHYTTTGPDSVLRGRIEGTRKQ